jgi:hypothetical protein
LIPDSPHVITKLRTYDRLKLAEAGRKGGLTKAANARRRQPAAAVELTGAELSALSDAYRLLGEIAQRARIKALDAATNGHKDPDQDA